MKSKSQAMGLFPMITITAIQQDMAPEKQFASIEKPKKKKKKGLD